MKFAGLLAKLIVPEDAQSGSFLAEAESRVVQRIVANLPQDVSAAGLTKLSLAGALLTALGLLGCRFEAWPVLFVPLGVALNWFGSVVDGPLGVCRGEHGGKRRWVEHLADLVSLLMVIVAYGFSPFLSIESSLIILACFLLFSAYTFLRSASGRVVQTALIGIGATEFRILSATWPFIASALGLGRPGATGFARVDLAILILSMVAIVSLIVNIFVDGQKISSSQT
jgi:hypothetical protein